MKNKILVSCYVVLFILLLYLIFSFAMWPASFEPNEGVWYCEELQMQLSYENNLESYVVIDEKKIEIECVADPGSRWVSVNCQELTHTDYRHDETITILKIIKLKEYELVVYDEIAQIQYVFYRIR